MVETMKTCPKCGQMKHRREFSKNQTRKDGLDCWCKKCVSTSNSRNNEESRARNAASPVAHLSTNQRGNLGEDLAAIYYQMKGYNCSNPRGDGSPTDFFVDDPDGHPIRVQAKFASWSAGGLYPNMTNTRRATYLAAGVDVLFVIHPTEPYGWQIPMKAYAKTKIVTAKGVDNYAEYRVILPVHFTQAYIDSLLKEQDNGN